MQKDYISDTIKENLINLSKTNDILSSIINAISIQSKKDPFIGIYIFPDNGKNIIFDDKLIGRYDPEIKKISYYGDFIKNINDFNGSLLHECTHQLMDILYGKIGEMNYLNPYLKEDKDRKKAFENAAQQVFDNIWNDNQNGSKISFKIFALLSNYYDALNIILTSHAYSIHKYHEEYIARFIEIIARGYYNDPAVQKIFEPFMVYWTKYIAPDIDDYIAKNRKCTVEIGENSI